MLTLFFEKRYDGEMKSSTSNKGRIYGSPIRFLNNGGWNPTLHPRNSIGEFVYTDGGLHGRSTHVSLSPAKKSTEAAQAIPYRLGYRRIGLHMVKTDEIPANSQTFRAPDNQNFSVPAGTNFQDVYNAGKANGYAGMKSQIWQYGKFDFQRNGGNGLQTGGLDNVFYSAYTNASNYAVGVYMNGAGANLWETLAVATSSSGYRL